MKRLGILGGTFNPIHKGHLALAKAARKKFLLDKVIFIPTGTPPHKPHVGIVDKKHRYKMVILATQNSPYFSVSRLEMDRPGVSYAVDTFRILQKKFGKKAKLFYIMGLDSINEILEWRQPLELFKLCEIIVGTRPGSKLQTFKRLLKTPPLQAEAKKIHLLELKQAVSSSQIRLWLKDGKSVRRFLPKVVTDYISQSHLYQGNN